MGESGRDALMVHFDARGRLEFQGAAITSDAGLLACRELDEALTAFVSNTTMALVEDGEVLGSSQFDP